MINRKKIFIISLLQVSIYLITIYLLSTLIYSNKTELLKTSSLVASFFHFEENVISTFSFIEFFDVIKIVFQFSGILCSVSLFHYLASASESKILEVDYVKWAKIKIQKIKTKKKIKIIFWTLIILIQIILIIFEREILFLVICYACATFLGYKYYKNLTLDIKNKENKTWWEVLSKNKNLLIYLGSFTISLFLIDGLNEIVYIPLFLVVIHTLFQGTTYLLKVSLKFLFLEYNFAEIDKRREMNSYIFDLIFKYYKSNNLIKVKEELKYTLLFTSYSLNKKDDFISLLADTNFPNKVKSELTKIYNNIVIEYVEISKVKAEIVILRNYKNLMVSIMFSVVVLGIIFLQNVKLFEFDFVFNAKLVLYVIFSLLFYRLLVRSLEIAIAFYKDIKPDTKLKNTNLSNNKRMGLVLKSLLEITIFSGLLYTLIGVFIINDKVNILNVIYSGFTHSLATAAFNTSFPFDTFSSIKLKGAIYDYPVTRLFSWMTMIQLIHLIQLIMSVVLISLSITSYGSKNSDRSLFIFKFKDNKYQFLESSIDGKIKKLIYENEEMNYLIKEIELDWKKNKFDFLQYEKIQESINLHLLKQ